MVCGMGKILWNLGNARAIAAPAGFMPLAREATIHKLRERLGLTP